MKEKEGMNAESLWQFVAGTNASFRNHSQYQKYFTIFHLLSCIRVETFRQKLQNVKYFMTNALILHYEKKRTSPYEI
jgi:hypothetical protein